MEPAANGERTDVVPARFAGLHRDTRNIREAQPAFLPERIDVRGSEKETPFLGRKP